MNVGYKIMLRLLMGNLRNIPRQLSQSGVDLVLLLLIGHLQQKSNMTNELNAITMKIYSADLRRKNYLISRLLVGNWSDVRRRVGLKQVPVLTIQLSPHTGYWELRTDWEPIINWKLGNHRLIFIYNEIRYYDPEMIRVTKILHKQVDEN